MLERLEANGMKFYEKLLCLVLKLAFLYPLIEKRTIKVRRFFDEEETDEPIADPSKKLF